MMTNEDRKTLSSNITYFLPFLLLLCLLSTEIKNSAGIGFGPNGILAMDFLEAGFRAKYESVCVGNLAAEDEDVFFEGLLCKEGLGEFFFWILGGFDCLGFFFFSFFFCFFNR